MVVYGLEEKEDIAKFQNRFGISLNHKTMLKPFDLILGME